MAWTREAMAGGFMGATLVSSPRWDKLRLTATASLPAMCLSSADFQSAVSPNCIRQRFDCSKGTEILKGPQITNLRYSRLEICVTFCALTLKHYAAGQFLTT